MPLGITKAKLKFTLGRGTEWMHMVEVNATVVDTTAYDVILGMEFVTAMKGDYDSYTELFTYRCEDGSGGLLSHSITAPCHTMTPPVMAYACFAGLIGGEAELHDVQGASDDIIPEEEDWGYHSAPHQLVAAQLSILSQAVERVELTQMQEEVRGQDLTRRENAAVRLAVATSQALTPLLPTSKWLGVEVMGSSPINTATRQFSAQAKSEGLHVLELFGGIGLGVLRTALAAGYTVRCYTYVDRDAKSRRIAKAALAALQTQYPQQLPATAVNAFDKRLPQDVAQCSELFLTQLVAMNGPVDLLGVSWECQSVSRAGRQRGAMDPRFQYFYDLVRMVNFFQRTQPQGMIYILENTYPGERCTTAVQKASDLVQAFIGAPVVVDGANLGGAAHRVRLFWTNMVQPAVLQATLPTLLKPEPHPNHSWTL